MGYVWYTGDYMIYINCARGDFNGASIRYVYRESLFAFFQCNFFVGFDRPDRAGLHILTYGFNHLKLVVV